MKRGTSYLSTAVRKGACLTIVAGLVGFVPAYTEVVEAKRAKFTGRVSINNKNANTEYYVWQSTVPGGANYVNTGFTIQTDAGGRGTVQIPNVASGALLSGHNVKIGDFDNPSNQAAKRVDAATWFFGFFGRWFASVEPGVYGPSTGTFAQAVVADDGTTLLETWDTGTMLTMRLDPAEAEWVDFGASISTRGDLVAELVSLTSTELKVRVVQDPTFDTLDDLVITGLGLNVRARPGEHVNMYLDFIGSTSVYVDGEFVEQLVWDTSQTYLYDRLTVVPEPASLLVLGVGLAGLLGLRRRLKQ